MEQQANKNGFKSNQGMNKGSNTNKEVQNVSMGDFEALQGIQEADDTPLEPYYQVIHSGLRAGVWFHDVGMAKDGTEYMKPPMKLSDPFEIIGRGQGLDEQEYRVLQYKRVGSREYRQVAMPLEIVGCREGWAFLRGLGIGVNQNGTTMAHLANYLQWEGDRSEWLIVNRGGWVDSHCTAYILPNGEVIGTTQNKVIYIGDTSKKQAYKQSGDLAQWQQHIARYLVGNSRPLLALGAVFASPLLEILKQESGGFHFFGSSSIGKSISGLVAVSAMANPEGARVQWKGTSLGFDNEAAANNDGLLFLDEIGEADQKTVKEVGYSIFNGVSKLQGAKQGGNRARLTWRILAISTGEFTAEHYLKTAGFEWNAGQAVRLPAVPADTGKGLGVFDVLHDMPDAKSLAIHLDAAAKTYYGTAWRAYLTALAERMQSNPLALRQRLQGLQAEFNAMLPPLNSQPARAAKRFALVAAALELASELGITGFERGIGFAGVLACFQAWYERDGIGNREEVLIIKNARDFLLEVGMSERFVNLAITSSGNYEAKRNHAGFRIPANEDCGKPRFFVLDKAFEDEICKGFDVRFVCRVLRDCGWLITEGRNFKVKIPLALTKANIMPKGTRLYCFKGDVPPAEWDAE